MKRKKKSPRRWEAIARRMPADEKLYGAEIGVFEGAASVGLLSSMPRLTLYMIDRWAQYTEAERERDRDSQMVRFDQRAFSQAEKKAADRVRPFGNRAHIMKLGSLSASEAFTDGSLNFVFLDGDHSYEGVSCDIIAWMPKVRAGGWLCGHDYTASGKRPGVTRAVHEAFGSDVETDSDSTWFWRVPCE